MDSKVSEKDMREVYFQAFGKEYDSADRKQAPLPIEIAYLVALQKLEREGKYAGGGEITDDNYYQSVNHFVYFCLNYPNNFYDAFDSHLKNHLSNKFKDYYNKYGVFGVMMKFYAELDAENRTLFTNWILKNYKGSPISSDISEKEYHNIVNHFFYFAMNYPSNFLDAFSSYLRPHLSEKWTSAFEKKGSMGAMVQFWSELDTENRKDFCVWIKKNYTGTPLYEMGGGLGDVAGMLPSPLPMSTIQPMADGGSVDDFDSTGTSMVIYHEKEGNFMIPKGQIYLYLYDIEKSGKKIQSGEFDWVFYPFASLSMIGQKGFIPPLKRIWTKNFQKEHKGSEHLLGVIKAFLIDKENGEKELYVDMMSVNPNKKKKGIMSFMLKDLRENFDLSQNQVTFSQLTKEGEKFVEKGKYSDGGGVEYEVILWGVKVGEPNWAEQIITKQEDKIEDAKKWAEKNGFDRFRISKVKLDKPDFTKTFSDGGNVRLKYYVIDAKDGKILSKGFNTEEQAKEEKYKTFEKTENFFLTIKKMSDGGDVDDTKFKEGVKVETTVFMSTEDIGSEEDIEVGTIGTVLSEPNDEEDLVLVEINGVGHYLPQFVLEVVSEFANNNDDCINLILTSVNKIKPIADFGISDKKLIIIVKEQLTIDEIELLNNNLKNIKGCSEITDDEFTISYKENNKTLILNLKTDDLSIQKFNNGGGVKSDYYIFEGVDNLNGNPLYRVESTSENENEYVGEWHTDKSDAEKELKSFYAYGGGVDDDSKFLNFKKQLIKYSDFNEKTGDGFSSRYVGLKNKKGDKSNGQYLIEGNQIIWVYIDARGNEYISDEIPELIIDLIGKKESFDNGGGVDVVWIALSKTKNGLLLSERFDKQITHKQLFDFYKKMGYEIIDSNIFKVTNKGALDVFKDAISKFIKEKYNELVDWENSLLSYEIVGDRIIAQSCFVQTKNGNEYKITPNDLLNKKFNDGGGVDDDLEDDFKKALVTSNFTYYTDNSDGLRMFRNSDNEELTGGTFAENSLTEDIENNDIVWASEDMKYNIDAMREKYSLGGILLSVGAGAFAYKLYLDYKKQKDKKRLEDFIKDEAKYYSKKIKSKINIDDDFQEDEERASRRMERDSDDMFQEREERASRRMERDSDDMFQERE